MGSELILITGGARSGKSSFAEQLADQGGKVLFVATAEALDDDMERRIAAHRASRPFEWHTLEEPLDLSASIRKETKGGAPAYDVIIVDCLTMWVSNMLLHEGEIEAEARTLAAARELLEVCDATSGKWIMVTNEVGLGVVPSSSLGRTYRDVLGRVNALVASRADKVYLMAAGLALDLKALGARHISELNAK